MDSLDREGVLRAAVDDGRPGALKRQFVHLYEW